MKKQTIFTCLIAGVLMFSGVNAGQANINKYKGCCDLINETKYEKQTCYKCISKCGKRDNGKIKCLHSCVDQEMKKPSN